jgi:hypothetical protein
LPSKARRHPPRHVEDEAPVPAQKPMWSGNRFADEDRD